MSWEPRPLPEIYPETERYWEAAAAETLLLQECQDCGCIYHYPRSFCPDCFGNDVEWVESNGTGEIYSYTVIRQLADWNEEDLPVIYAVVRLDEGPKISTNIVGVSPDDVSFGDDVEVSFIATEKDDVAIPVFEPAK